MRGTVIVAFFFATLFGARLPAADQDERPIERQLKEQYHLSQVGANGKVFQAGSALIVQQDNIKANPAWGQVYWPNSYKRGDGVKQPRVPIKVIVHLGELARMNRLLQVGERVYLTEMEVKASEIVFKVQSCGKRDQSGVDPDDLPYRAELSFEFQKGFVDSANLKEIQDTIGQVFAIAPAVEDSSSTNAPKSEAALPPPIIDPPPPPADQPLSKTLSVGDTKDHVVAAFGQPERIVTLDTKEIFYYKDLKITFISGKVTDIQ